MGLVFRALALLPLPVLYWLADGLYVIVFHVVRWRVALARRNIAGAFPEKSVEERERILRDSYRNLCRTLMEAIWGFRAPGAALAERIVYENPEVIERHKAAGTTLVLLTAHTCNWEWLLLASGVRFAFPIDAVYKRLALKGVDAYVRDARSRFGGNPIPFETFLFELMRRPPEPHARQSPAVDRRGRRAGVPDVPRVVHVPPLTSPSSVDTSRRADALTEPSYPSRRVPR